MDGSDKACDLPLRTALRVISEVIDLLDANDGPQEATVHLELAASEVRSRLDRAAASP
jgi:hypothetical protein